MSSVVTEKPITVSKRRQPAVTRDELQQLLETKSFLYPSEMRRIVDNYPDLVPERQITVFKRAIEREYLRSKLTKGQHMTYEQAELVVTKYPHIATTEQLTELRQKLENRPKQLGQDRADELVMKIKLGVKLSEEDEVDIESHPGLKRLKAKCAPPVVYTSQTTSRVSPSDSRLAPQKQEPSADQRVSAKQKADRLSAQLKKKKARQERDRARTLATKGGGKGKKQ